ncbi:hypothetical protein AWM75_05725 [Aerococcus urinaehominis]|uniref:Uncharacterized protein n=1 Tax=Aerococcus urinaehominis TaxID=128944 RepID=A0A0X8FLI6_9LACT|nr:alpha/beta hydrolase fold domain-containing protein [Aerococcus urinaehominis]AMB99526.1 hypothetical protein AWM75_05725 [Aerococcus urinaehominis]SDM33929.1 Acetyl esterase/lipase [Aerococcus urinaehominis]
MTKSDNDKQILTGLSTGAIALFGYLHRALNREGDLREQLQVDLTKLYQNFTGESEAEVLTNHLEHLTNCQIKQADFASKSATYQVYGADFLSSRQALVYLPGNYLVGLADQSQHKFAERLARQCQRPLYLVDYPKWPQTDYDNMVASLAQTIDEILAVGSHSHVVLVADQAASNLALTLGKSYNQAYQISQIVLLSPAINNQLGQLSKVLNSNQHKDFATGYLVGLDFDPIYLANLPLTMPPLTMLVASKDANFLASLAYYRQLKNRGLAIRCYQFDDHQANFYLRQLNESLEAAEIISDNIS